MPDQGGGARGSRWDGQLGSDREQFRCDGLFARASPSRRAIPISPGGATLRADYFLGRHDRSAMDIDSAGMTAAPAEKRRNLAAWWLLGLLNNAGKGWRSS